MRQRITYLVEEIDQSGFGLSEDVAATLRSAQRKARRIVNDGGYSACVTRFVCKTRKRKRGTFGWHYIRVLNLNTNGAWCRGKRP